MNEAALAMTGELATAIAANTNTDTRSLPARTSHLKEMGRSPAHCRNAMLNDREASLSMRIGSGAHSLILGGPDVLLCPTKQRRGKEYDLWRKGQPADAIVLLPKEYKKAHGIAAAVRANRLACQVLFAPGTVYEGTIFWERNGRARRSTPDARTLSHLADLKTCRSAEPEKFRWDAIKLGYHIQMGDYAEAMKVKNGFAPKDVYIVAVEQNAPHVCTVHRLTTGALERGLNKADEWLGKLIECEASGIWPGYADQILDFDVPIDPVDLEWGDEDDNDDKEAA